MVLQALSGRVTPRVPVGLFTWGFEYLWKAASMEPWRLACGGAETWFQAHRALYDRHRPDMIWYEGAGSGSADPSLLEETSEKWIIRDNNTQQEFELIKKSFSLCHRQTKKKGCDSVGTIETEADADRLVPLFAGWGDNYLGGLKRLIDDLGNRALVLPHHSPAYICACYALGFEGAMEAMLTAPRLFRHVCDRYAEGDRRRMREWASAGAEVCFIADGWASCDIISRETFIQFAWPYQKSIIQAAHDAGLKVILWNEGNILPILDLEAELEMDAFAFEQPRKNIEVSVDKVRHAFGPRRCLLGNLDSEQLLIRNDPGEIKQAVQRQLDQSGPKAPFILNTGSPIPSNVDPSAVEAMITAAGVFT